MHAESMVQPHPDEDRQRSLQAANDVRSSQQVYEVEVTELRPRTWQVIASDAVEACRKALLGQGDDVSGVDYVEGQIVAIRQAAPHVR
jgi:hypothetical protein